MGDGDRSKISLYSQNACARRLHAGASERILLHYPCVKHAPEPHSMHATCRCLTQMWKLSRRDLSWNIGGLSMPLHNQSLPKAKDINDAPNPVEVDLV